MWRAASLLLLLLTAAVYFWRLGEAPIYLAPDEVIIANDAYVLATTGRALDGTLLPLYFRAGVYGSWFMPMIYYAMALVLQVLPFVEWAIRVPTVLAAVLSIALTYFAGLRLYGDRLAALVAAFVLASAPAFFILSRYALDYTWPVPFILGWLLCLLIALDSPRSRWWLAASGLCLGVGWYSYISSIVMMPLYVLATIGVLLARRRDWRDAAAFVAGFALPLTLFISWLNQHPDAIVATARRYGFIEGQSATTGAMLQAFDAGAMVARYLNFFTFDFLFRLGDTYLPFSTRNTGVFVGGAGLLMAAGVYAALTTYRSAISILVVLGFLVSPLAASILLDEGAIRRATGMLPFGALLAGLGAAAIARMTRVPLFKPLALTVAGVGVAAGVVVMARTAMTQGRISETASLVIAIGIIALLIAVWSARQPHGALILLPIALLIAMQFVTFQRSYHGEYMSRVAIWLQGNIRGALVQLMAESDRRPEAPLSVTTLRSGRGDWDQRNLYLPSYWRFYTTKQGREDLFQKTMFIKEQDDLQATPAGSLVLGNHEDPHFRKWLDAGALRLADIPEVDREPFFTIAVR